MKKITIILLSSLAINAFSQQQVPNGSFENWSGPPNSEPTGWFTLNSITSNYPTYGAVITSDAYDGNYALKLISGRVDATPFGFPKIDTTAMAALGILTPQGPKYGVPFTSKPQKLSFYYKYFPGSTPPGVVDTGHINIKFTNMGADVGEGIFRFYGSPVSSYTYAEILISWFSSATPDTLIIDISSSTTGFSRTIGSESDDFTNQIGSTLYIDKLEFLYPTSINEIHHFHQFSIYPNPTNCTFTIKTEKGGEFELMDITGKIINSYIIKNEQKTLHENLPAGMYFVREEDSGSVQKLFIE
jgi:hypothetical protein